ncbi:MAG: hypothetical protein JJ971_08755 [Balneolaceae bacterium]|nr:hypothetical protein [Balneolaceae bacterium]MBO6546670.1 hypothetical protein [Balneolaceae bacterium]MBO6649028.1 hypothetical protein [Balneolaceae bacterium]
MKISVIGTGKTGSKVVELLGDRSLYAFDESTLPTIEKLKESDAVIIFVPGEAVSDILDLVLKSRIPAAWGSTGFEWPQDLDDLVKAAKTKWVLATNFSLGMNIIRHSIKKISEGSKILENPNFEIQEIHHIHKKDAPSGTALSWKEWLDKDVEITSIREGDVNGVHELRLSTSREEIALKHEALDRSIFAEGAIWTAEQLVNNLTLSDGVHTFGELFDLVMKES